MFKSHDLIFRHVISHLLAIVYFINSIMRLFKADEKAEPSGEPPSYDELQENHPGEPIPIHNDQKEYLPEKDNSSQSSNPQDMYTVPQNIYTVPSQMINIAYEQDGDLTRPEYKEYLKRDQQRVAQGDFPKPREAFAHGAPLNPGKKSNQSSGGFPGRSGATYHESANK